MPVEPLLKVTSARCRSAGILELEFSDGLKATVDISDRLFGPVFAPLQDPLEFQKAFIDEFGVVCWPNGADISTEFLYKRAKLG